ncbi:MAG: ClpX C4-type zinc finger protein, partial [Pseudomonadota bacterium]
MTTRKRFKALIRAYAKQHGLSYTAALRRLRTRLKENAERNPMTTVKKIDLGFSFEQPDDARMFEGDSVYTKDASFIHGMNFTLGDHGASVSVHHAVGADLEKHVATFVDELWVNQKKHERTEDKLHLGTHAYLRVRYQLDIRRKIDLYFLMRDADCIVFNCSSSSDEVADACEKLAESVTLFDPARSGMMSEVALPRYTPSTRRSLRLATQLANMRGHLDLTDEDLIAGLVLNHDTSASNMLARYGVTREALQLDPIETMDQKADCHLNETMYSLLTDRAFWHTEGKIRSMHLLLALMGRPQPVIAAHVDAHRFRYSCIRSLQQEMDLNPLFCDFCGASHHDVEKLIAGPNSYICNDCVERALDELRSGTTIDAEVHCSFCGKRADEVDGKMLSSWVSDEDDARHVCHECV